MPLTLPERKTCHPMLFWKPPNYLHVGLLFSLLLSPGLAQDRASTQLESSSQEATRTAIQAFEEGQRVYQQGTIESKRQAIEKWEEALLLLPVSNNRDKAVILNNIGSTYLFLGETQTALKYLNQALPLTQIANDPKEEGNTLSNIGTAYIALGERRKALEFLNRGRLLSQTMKDLVRESAALNNIGEVYAKWGEQKEALQHYNQALFLLKEINDREGQVGKITILYSIGNVYLDLNEWQNALDFFDQSLLLAKTLGARERQADTLNRIGWVYQSAGEREQALNFFNSSLLLYQEIGSRKGQSASLTNIGSIYYDLGERKKTLEYYAKALQLRQAGEDLAWYAGILNDTASILLQSRISTPQEVLKYHDQALRLYQAVGSREGEAMTLNKIGEVHYDLRDEKKALHFYKLALLALQASGNSEVKALTLANLAFIYRIQGDLRDSLELINTAIAILEKERPKIYSDNLRISYLSERQDYYQFKIDVLMQLQRQQPHGGYNVQAMETSDRARARGLIELLTESRADIRKGIGDDLLEREKDLQQKLDATEKRFTQLSNNSATQSQSAGIQQEIKNLYQAQNQLKDEIRKASPAYANLKYPEPLKLAEIQQQLDPDTVLLQYSLGEEHSYLWSVTKMGMTSYTLPKRSDIEKAATQFRDLLRDPGMQGVAPTDQQKGISLSQTANQLSTLILAPAAAELKRNRRIVIVADGALHTIPFAALTVPGSDSTTYNPLVKHHEIVNLPSASTIAILRETVTKNRKPALKTLALLADPVFSKEDERFTGKLGKSPSLDLNLELERSALDRATRNLNLSNLSRLKASGEEATQILALVPPPQQLSAVGFDATYEWATSPQLRQYRFLHFATHGLFDPKQPELSGLVFSRIDKQGNPRRDFLRLPDLFNLDLPAELIVLSACETGLGTVVQGEGIVGMTRGLMYAGTPRVVVSLWRVNDAATATLMQRFYEEIQQGKSPPVALQSAQQWMAIQEAYQNPYSWAGFVVQGEWRWDAAVAKAATQ